MKEHDKVLQRKKNIILATVMLFVLNAVLIIPLTNVTPDQTGMQITSWNKIFIHVRLFSFLMYIVYLFSLFEKTAKIEKRIAKFIVAHIDIIFLYAIFVYLVIYELYTAYFANYFISPDSSSYMREASALLEGNGFYVDKLAGYDTWFASWPIGYPVLIALSTFISGKSVYFASKLLSVALVGFGLLVLYLRFKKDAWIFSLIYLNVGFLKIYGFTWSENPFILNLLIWGIALAAIIEEELPKKRWYVIMVFGILGAFLTRYFGIVTILFTGFCLLLYIIYYFWVNRSILILSKIKGLLCVEFFSSAVVGLYLTMNRIMGGQSSGVNRLAWWDDYNTLITNLFEALTAEIFNATRVDTLSLMPNFYPESRAVVVILFLGVLVHALIKNYQAEKKIDYKTIFIGAGVFYYLLFIVIRFYSSMDRFNHRFFAPAGMMVSIGGLGLIRDKFQGKLKNIQIVICLFLVVLCGGLIQNIMHCTTETSAYYIFYDKVVSPVESIPSKGMILNYSGDYQLQAFRPDIMTNGQIAYDDTMETIALKYDKSDSIWIQRNVLNAIVNDENYSEEIRNSFSQYVVDGADEMEYIQIY